jgi:AmmeMemoRadiSam system protein B
VNTLRNAIAAGQFYPANETRLRQQIEQCFLDKRGYGVIPSVQKKQGPLKGLVVPHAGFIYSGAIASHAYGRLAEQGFGETFIIIGPNHTGMGSGVSVMTQGSWETPFGQVPIDKDLAARLATGIVDNDSTAHIYEHSIEVQLPFLQFIGKNKDFSFIPLCMMMQDYDTAREVGEILATVLQNSSKQVILIASSDFSHVGFNYQSNPPEGIRVDEYAKQQDALAIHDILSLNPRQLIQTVEEHSISMCGYGPVAAMLTAVKKLNAQKAELLKYGTSYEVHPDTSCVGYGAVMVT